MAGPRPYVTHAVEPGGLSEQDHGRIVDMAERGLKCGPIARQLRKNPSTVRWFMYRNGLAVPARRPARLTDKPNAAGCKGYSLDEDRLVVQLRTEGLSPGEIAARVTERFGHPRTRHSINVRLTMLANLETLDEAC